MRRLRLWLARRIIPRTHVVVEVRRDWWLPRDMGKSIPFGSMHIAASGARGREGSATITQLSCVPYPEDFSGDDGVKPITRGAFVGVAKEDA